MTPPEHWGTAILLAVWGFVLLAAGLGYAFQLLTGEIP